VRKIAPEEHFVTPELAKYGASTSTLAQPHLWAEASRRPLDFTQEHLPEMDRFGLDVQVLSLNSPGIQAEPEAAVAVRAALAVNDLLASVIGGRVRPGHAPHSAKPRSALLTVRSQSRHGPIAGSEQGFGRRSIVRVSSRAAMTNGGACRPAGYRPPWTAPGVARQPGAWAEGVPVLYRPAGS
jgi:hypothetical protein